MTEPTTPLSTLTLAELKNLVEGLVDDRLRVLLGDPDLGAPLGESVRERLKTSSRSPCSPNRHSVENAVSSPLWGVAVSRKT